MGLFPQKKKTENQHQERQAALPHRQDQASSSSRRSGAGLCSQASSFLAGLPLVPGTSGPRLPSWLRQLSLGTSALAAHPAGRPEGPGPREATGHPRALHAA